MNAARQDVFRLFKHFGLDPAGYVDTSTATVGESASGQSRAIPAKSEKCTKAEGNALKSASDGDPLDD